MATDRGETDTVGEIDPAAEADAKSAEPERLAAEYEDRWKRTAADLDNLRKRYARELERERAAERARVASAWLPVVDNIEAALAHATSDSDSIVEGLRAIREEALAVLARLGYPRRDDVGKSFDPTRHEVVSVVEEEGAAPGTIVEVLRPGYGDGSGQLRPATVAVAGRRE